MNDAKEREEFYRCLTQEDCIQLLLKRDLELEYAQQATDALLKRNGELRKLLANEEGLN